MQVHDSQHTNAIMWAGQRWRLLKNAELKIQSSHTAGCYDSPHMCALGECWRQSQMPSHNHNEGHAAGGYDSPHTRAAARAEGALAASADAALAEKAAKARLALAADHFNRDYKKGFQFLQVRAATCWKGTKNPKKA